MAMPRSLAITSGAVAVRTHLNMPDGRRIGLQRPNSQPSDRVQMRLSGKPPAAPVQARVRESRIAADAEPTLRSIGLSVYLPSLLFAAGQGAVVPIVPLVARDFGASVALAGVIVGIRGIGTMVFDLPAGTLVARLGDRRAMTLA